MPPAQDLPMAWEVSLPDLDPINDNNSPATGLVWVLSYRSMIQVADQQASDALIENLRCTGCRVRHFAVYSLRDVASQQFLEELRQKEQPDLVLCLHGLAAQDTNPLAGLPVFQLVQASNDAVAWSNGQGLSPADIASKVALPELDGRILSGVVSFRRLAERDEKLQCQLQHQAPEPNQLSFTAQQVAAHFNLKHTDNSQRRIAIVLANYPTSDGRMANGVGLDTLPVVVRYWPP